MREVVDGNTEVAGQAGGMLGAVIAVLGRCLVLAGWSAALLHEREHRL